MSDVIEEKQLCMFRITFNMSARASSKAMPSAEKDEIGSFRNFPAMAPRYTEAPSLAPRYTIPHALVSRYTLHAAIEAIEG